MTALSPPLAAAPPPAAVRRRFGRIGIAGVVSILVWIAVGIGVASSLAGSFDADLIARYGPAYLEGLRTTVVLVAFSFAIGALLSVPIAFGRMSQNSLATAPAFAFVYFFRGTPLLAQVYLVYYGFGQFSDALRNAGLWWFFRDAWFCAVFALSLNTAAYQAEILRGAINSVPRGQWEGARSLGLSRSAIFWKVILPQAMIVALRPYANEVILMVKASAIVSIVTVLDLLGQTRRAYSRTFDFQTYIWAAILYLLIVEVLRHATNAAERRLVRHLKR